MNLDFQNGASYKLKVAPGGWKKGAVLKTLTITRQDNRLWVKFPFNKKLIDEIKNMGGARWHGFEDPPIKCWSIKLCSRNLFALQLLAGGNPYERYDRPLETCPPSERPLMQNQKELIAHFITRGQALAAADMGMGKSLAAIEAAEYFCASQDLSGHSSEFWYVGPRAGVYAFGMERRKWDCKINFEMMTYEGLVKIIRTWPGGGAPRFVCFDECSKIKNMNAQRSQSSLFLADAMRKEHGVEQIMITELSGTPSPKSPVDWWHQCEVACPGFLKEGHPGKFRKRLCLTEERESASGQAYPHLITWLDDTKKCAVCGQAAEDDAHVLMQVYEAEIKLPDEDMQLMGYRWSNNCWIKSNEQYHEFESAVNEVATLHKRMEGLVIVQDTKNYIDLPERIDTVIDVMPTPEMVRAGKLIAKTAPRAIQALTLMRELSDGFQYVEVEAADSPITCEHCHGRGKVIAPVPTKLVDLLAPLEETIAIDIENQEIECPTCRGTGKVKNMVRTAKEVPTPKDPIFIDELDANVEIGRFITWAGFTASIDRLVRICHQNGWATLRIDGRGFVGETHDGKPIDSEIALRAMDGSDPEVKELAERIPKLCVVGHPKSGGMALTLHAAQVAFYYSLDYDGEGFMQSAKRHHRVGMDNRPALVKVIHCMPVDEMVHNNLLKKVNLQKMSMGQIQKAFEGA